ncbi:multivesicular body subunit 12B-like isoform X2 [Mya arenaria]|nr:multivesicular body subunit 12B-like isoform X2 [Mya arenaria]XP_052789782.1 multivesicular body subunit 12B-like isoform X2 [Mya arenaria]
MTTEDWPITAVVVVADIGKCPAGYTTIDRTYDRTEEADLWRDGLFGRRVTRYLCVQRAAPTQGREVLVDVSIINERDPVPAGFTVVDTTEDTREKAIKKKVLCVRWMNASLTTSALSELIFLGKGTRRPPNGYTMVGDLNNLMLCYKMSQIKSISSIVHQNSSDSPLDNIGNMNNDLPYAINPRREDAYSQGSSAPARHNNTLDRQGSILTVTPLSGVPWQLNPRLQSLNNLNNVHIPEIRYKSIMDIENQYSYCFDVERTARTNNG